MATKPAAAPVPEAITYCSVYAQLRVAFRDHYLIFVDGSYTTCDPAEQAVLNACSTCDRSEPRLRAKPR